MQKLLKRFGRYRFLLPSVCQEPGGVALYGDMNGGADGQGIFARLAILLAHSHRWTLFKLDGDLGIRTDVNRIQNLTSERGGFGLGPRQAQMLRPNGQCAFLPCCDRPNRQRGPVANHRAARRSAVLPSTDTAVASSRLVSPMKSATKRLEGAS